jgi:hypothetical protein
MLLQPLLRLKPLPGAREELGKTPTPPHREFPPPWLVCDPPLIVESSPVKKVKSESEVVVLDSVSGFPLLGFVSCPIDLILSQDDEDTLSSNASNVATNNDVDAEEEEDDMETPKASKINGKKKAGNLKTELGGEVGISNLDNDVFASGTGLLAGIEEIPISSLPSSKFTLNNKDKWAGTWLDDQQKTYLYVKYVHFEFLAYKLISFLTLSLLTYRARSSDDPFLSQKYILDPWMSKRGLYKNLPNAK